MKKAISWACWADLAKVALTVPMLMPDRMHRAAAESTSGSWPWKGTPNASLMTAIPRIDVMNSRTNSGATFAMMISEVLAGDISNCSMVPASRSFTMAPAATSELFRINNSPRTPVTMNQESFSPGL